MYPPGLRVRHITTSDGHEPNATVVRSTDFGDIVIKVDGDPVPITTRSCFLIP
jgi:hypothetical protein